MCAVAAKISRLKIDGHECRFFHPLSLRFGQFGNPFENPILLQLPPRHNHPQRAKSHTLFNLGLSAEPEIKENP